MKLPTKKFTIEDYHKMSDMGIFDYSDHLELIKGEIIQMSPIGSKHASCINKLNRMLNQKLVDEVIISIQNPIKLEDDSEPQPDVVLLKYRSDFYAEEHPKFSDILLLIEVADSSINYDRNVKIPLYAENKINQVWLIDLNEEYLEIYNNPESNYYRNMQKLSRKDTINLNILSSIEIQVSNLF